MREALLRFIKNIPFFYAFLRRINRVFYPVQLSNLEKIQKGILENLGTKDSVFFVQVGSNDGKQGDPLHDLVLTDHKWRGIFIEPVSYLFDRLQTNYQNSDRFLFERKAIAPSEGLLEFFYVSERAKRELGDELPYWYDQLGSFDRNHILKHLDGRLEPYIVAEKIETAPLQLILDKHGVAHVDLVHIDTERHDYKVLTTMDFSKVKPSVILYEHKHLSGEELTAAELLLNKNGYRCEQIGSDTLATY